MLSGEGSVDDIVAKYNVSSREVLGADGLTDKRGYRKTNEEVDELESLRRENLRLTRRLEEKDMVVELLKKVIEFEKDGAMTTNLFLTPLIPQIPNS